MVLEWLRLQDFRNIAQADLRFGAGLNLITGANGQGKSNLLEAVGLLATGRSFRHAAAGVMRRQERPWFRVVGGVNTGGVAHQLDFLGEESRQVVRLNGKPMVSVALMERVLVAVIVTPETPMLVRGGPGERRSFLDWVIFSAARRHGVESREYSRALRARNQLLKVAGREVREIVAWEAQLAVLGARIAVRRHDVLMRLARLLPDFLLVLDLVPERFDMVFSSQLEAVLPDVEATTDGLRQLLAESRERDRRSGVTSVGPHRDDLLFRLEGRPLARFGSRGQQKRFAFALKLAEAGLLEEALGDSPVLVLDDPASELDRDGMLRLMELLAGQGRQLFLAAREKGEIPWPTDRPMVSCEVTAGVFRMTSCH